MAAWDIRCGRVLSRFQEKTGEVEQRLQLYEKLRNGEPRPLDWKFERAPLLDFLERLEAKHGKLPAGLAEQPSRRPVRHRSEPHSYLWN